MWQQIGNIVLLKLWTFLLHMLILPRRSHHMKWPKTCQRLGDIRAHRVMKHGGGGSSLMTALYMFHTQMHTHTHTVALLCGLFCLHFLFNLQQVQQCRNKLKVMPVCTCSHHESLFYVAEKHRLCELLLTNPPLHCKKWPLNNLALVWKGIILFIILPAFGEVEECFSRLLRVRFPMSKQFSWWN